MVTFFSCPQNSLSKTETSGKISQFYLWNRLLDSKEMLVFTGSCNFTINKKGKILEKGNIPEVKKYSSCLTAKQACFLIGIP